MLFHANNHYTYRQTFCHVPNSKKFFEAVKNVNSICQLNFINSNLIIDVIVSLILCDATCDKKYHSCYRKYNWIQDYQM